MPTRTLSWLLLTCLPAASAVAHDPANPDIAVPPARYSPVLSGTESFRPVAPLPWGDVNRRVMPDAQRPAPETEKAAPNTKAEPKAKKERRGGHGHH